MLTQGNGAAFVASPCSGLLQPFAEEVVEIAAYANMWGRYTDNIILTVMLILMELIYRFILQHIFIISFACVLLLRHYLLTSFL